MNASEIKRALVDRAEEFAGWLFPAGRKHGKEWLVGSLAGEPGKSLAISLEGSKAGVWSDFATGERGSNLLELYIRQRQKSCVEAIRDCAEWLGQSVIRADQYRVPAAKQSLATNGNIWAGDIYQPTDAEIATAHKWAANLHESPTLCRRIGTGRAWKAETVRNLALELYLGWNPQEGKHGALIFIYDCGAKLRYRSVEGERVIRWAFGKAWLWRGAHLTWARKVYLCEGETDAITLIDAGVEEQEEKALVVALPSANSFKAEWAQLFRDKDIVLLFDDDSAGENATARVVASLRCVAGSLSYLNWEGLRHAS